MPHLKKYAQYLLGKCNGDVEFAKKITFNNAAIASYEGNLDRLDSEAEIFTHLKVLDKETS